MSQLQTRSLKESDMDFIISSWLMSNYSFMTSKRPSKKDYYREHQELVKQALIDDATIIACNSIDEDQIIGWINFGDDYINYIFVKEIFENMGVATALIGQTGLVGDVTCTHWTKLFNDKLSEKLRAKYNPYIFLKQKELHGRDARS